LAQSGSFPLSFAEHTGLTKEEGALSKDLLIGTSTVDIGVDFEVNFLLFESLDEGSFIQRLGRLGRHDGYERDGQRILFETFAAYAMLPKYSYERLETKLQGKTDLTREELLEAIKGDESKENKPIFSPVAEFKRYTKQWGVLQTAHILNHTKQQIKSQQEFAQELEKAYNRTFGVDMESTIRRYHGRIRDEDGKTIFEELISFRGSSPFDCGVYDATDDTFKTYDLFQIISNTDWQLMEPKEFLSRVEQRGLPTVRYDRAIAFLRVNGYHDERESFTLQIRKDLSDYAQDYFHKVVVLKGFQLDMRHSYVNDIKRILRRRKVLCLLSKKNRNEIRLRYKLPRLFPVYTLEDERGSVYSVTFGKPALLLETVLERVSVEHESWIV
jgi:CRISPR-associated endonuclease/helicase Cas3